MNRCEIIHYMRMFSSFLDGAIVFGSASVLVQHPSHFFRPANDIDLVVETHQLEQIAQLPFWRLERPQNNRPEEVRVVHQFLPIEIFSHWKMEDGLYLSYAKLREDSCLSNGLVCAPIRLVIEYKKCLNREKDQGDLRILANLL